MEAVIFILVLAPLLLWAQQHHQKRVSETDRVWEEAAEELEGELVLGDRHWYGRDPRVLYATVDRIQVKVDHYSVRSNNTSTTFTRMVANARGPAGLELQVYRTTALSGIAKALGFQDVATEGALNQESVSCVVSRVQVAALPTPARAEGALLQSLNTPGAKS